MGDTGKVFVMGALSVVSTVGWIFTLATRDNKPSPADPAIKPEPAPQLAAPNPGTTASVVLPRPRKGMNASLRESPWGALVAGVKPGAEVTILGQKDAAEKRGKETVMRRWYEVRTTSADDGETVTGWMHSDLLPGALPR